MIIRKAEVRRAGTPPREWLHYSDDGGLTQYGVYVETLQPGARSSERHWHEKEDEFLYVLAGEVTVVDDDGEHVLHPGDAAAWPAGMPDAHSVANGSAAPCIYIVVGTRVTHDVCHYPGSGERLHTEGEKWWIEDAHGAVLKSGRCKSPPGRD